MIACAKFQDSCMDELIDILGSYDAPLELLVEVYEDTGEGSAPRRLLIYKAFYMLMEGRVEMLGRLMQLDGCSKLYTETTSELMGRDGWDKKSSWRDNMAWFAEKLHAKK